MSSGIGIGISSVFGGPRGLPSDFSYGQKQFCDDDNATYTPTPKNPGGTWSISPALTGFKTATGAFSPYGVIGTFVVSHTLNGKTSTQTIVLNDSDEISTFTYPNSAYPQSGVNPTPTITGTGPGINTGKFSATPAGLSFVDVSTGEIDLSESALNSYVITYTSGSEFCADTAIFNLEVEDPYVGFKFRILVPAGADQTLALETVNGASAAPNSVINWGDGTGVQSLTTTTASNSFSTGTYDIEINAFDSTTPVDNFSVTSGEALVTEVIDWGGTPWYSLDSAFENCVNLTTFGTGTFKGLAGVDLTSCFESCTSLTSIDTKNWDISGGSTLSKFALGCVLVENIYLPKLTPRTGSWSQSFESVGTSVTDGCTFHFEGLDFTGSTSTSWSFGMRFTKINPLSSFKNWNFVKENIQMNNFFQSAEITGDDSILDMSGWATFSGNLGYFFFNFNAPSSVTGTKLKINNLNTADVRNLDSIFASAKFYFIEGFSTWAAVTYVPPGVGKVAGEISINAMLYNTINLAISSTDNLSDAFMDSLKPTLIKFAFRSIGKSLDNSEGSEWGAAPNLGTIDLSGITSAAQTQSLFSESRFSSGNIDFTNIKFPTIGMDLYRTFYLTKFSNSDSYIKLDTGVSGSTLKVTRLYDSFNGTKTRKITIGNSVDFSTNANTGTAYRGAFQNASGDFVDSTINTEIILPTNMDFSNTLDGSGVFLNMFNGTRGIDSIGSTKVALSTCQTNNFLRRLSATLPVCPPTIVTAGAAYMPKLDNGKYSGPQALVSNDYSTLISNGWTFGTLASEAPYFTLSSYSLVTGTESTATINSSYTGGTFTSSNTAIATVDASTGTVTTGADSGTCQIRYTLADGVCYNEVNLAVTIPLIANNFSFNFDGINDNLTMDPFDIPSPNSTLTMWFNSSDIGGPTGGNRVLTVLFSKQGRYFPYIDESAAGKIQIYVRDDAGSSIFTTSVDFNANEWYHLAITQSSTGLFFYINGQKMNSTALISRYPTALTRISGYPNNVYNLLGKIDEMAVWNATLTDAQILDIYNGRLGVTNETVDLSKYANLGGNLVYWNRMGD